MWPTFLSPWLPLIAAPLAIPPLILLYFLKLKRRRVPVSCTLLWKRAVQDLQVNSPFQKLRNNLLLILQLLVLLLAILAMSRPLIEVRKPLDDRVAILIDCSASMATVEADGRTRLEIAKEQARQLVDDMPEGHRAMIVPFHSVARTLGPLTDDKSALKRQIDSIPQTAGDSHIREAMQLANASATPIGEGVGTPDNPVSPLQVHLLSDGQIQDLLDLPPAEAALTMTRIGEATHNVGIVGYEVRREYERPEVASVLVRVRNYGPDAVDTDLSVYIDNRLQTAQPLHLEAGMTPASATQKSGDDENAAAPRTADAEPPDGSIATLAFNITHEGEGVLDVRLGAMDDFPLDDSAKAILLPARRVTALLVSDNQSFRDFMNGVVSRGLPVSEHVWMTTAEYESADDDALVEGGRSKYDVVIIDQHNTKRLPPGNYLFFGSYPILPEPPADDPTAPQPIRGGERDEDILIVDWKDTHPVLRYVSVERMSPIFEMLHLDMPSDAIKLVEAEKSPAISFLARDGRQYLVVAFDLVRDAPGGAYSLNTPWLHRVSFPIFLYNAIRFLSASASASVRDNVEPGEAVSIPAARRGGSIDVTRPDGKTISLETGDRLEARFGGTDDVGLYKVKGAAPQNDAFVVNLLDERESNIRPVDQLIVGGEAAIISNAQQRTNLPVWPFILMAGLAMLMVEWYVYNRRARV